MITLSFFYAAERPTNVGQMSLTAAPLQLSAIRRRDVDGLHRGFAFDPKDLLPFAPVLFNSSNGCQNLVPRAEYVITYDGLYGHGKGTL